MSELGLAVIFIGLILLGISGLVYVDNKYGE
jgi:hypothetical protein